MPRERKLQELSSIACRFQTVDDKSAELGFGIVVVQFSGTYRYGSAGTSDASYMAAMLYAAVRAWEAVGCILDLSGLTYTWGDDFDEFLPPSLDIPSALVVGEHCAEAIRTLLHGQHSPNNLDSAPWIHWSLSDAVNFIRNELVLGN